MANAADLIAVAAAEIGQAETPPGSNVTKYGAWYGITGPWCAMFASWCAVRAGLSIGPGPKGFAYCPTGVAWFRGAGRWHDGADGIATGDLAFYSFKSGGLADHVEIVEIPGDPLTTIGGNVADRVGRWHRSPSSVIGYGRLPELAGGGGGGATPIGLTLPSIPNPFGNPLDALKPLADVLTSGVRLATLLGDPRTWLRLLTLAAGLGLVVAGLVVINRDSLLSAGKSAATAAALA